MTFLGSATSRWKTPVPPFDDDFQRVTPLMEVTLDAQVILQQLVRETKNVLLQVILIVDVVLCAPVIVQ